jgi:hypothetical protein
LSGAARFRLTLKDLYDTERERRLDDPYGGGERGRQRQSGSQWGRFGCSLGPSCARACLPRPPPHHPGVPGGAGARTRGSRGHVVRRRHREQAKHWLAAWGRIARVWNPPRPRRQCSSPGSTREPSVSTFVQRPRTHTASATCATTPTPPVEYLRVGVPLSGTEPARGAGTQARAA